MFKEKWVLVWVELRMNGERENFLPVIIEREREKKKIEAKKVVMCTVTSFVACIYVGFRLHFASTRDTFGSLDFERIIHTFHTLCALVYLIPLSFFSRGEKPTAVSFLSHLK